MGLMTALFYLITFFITRVKKNCRIFAERKSPRQKVKKLRS